MSENETASPISGTLPIEARTVFRLSSAIFYVIGLVITGALVFAAVWFDWPVWLRATAYGLLAIAVIYSLVDIIVFQKWKQERFTYLVQPLEIRLHHGIITTHDVLIPMTKVQYVHAKQGPLLRKFGLQTITIGTAGGSHEIYAIEESFAKTLREQIAVYARIEEEDVV
ncbi:PH domain-containing protein [Exiguobacterium aurantiacum]|uniref:Bacterial membrane flanked domain n=1 Tax=Exiguobacterium aurantiacum TaxID=33987 RepID=A0A377FV12_9BACL|nr:PH domain-containing protein [Exiguobacterium aurantiacum]STO08173.1 Bacterial membrane flanked domain [Exiguobacterium aurantiacum]